MEHKIQIEFIHLKSRFHRLFGESDLIQTKPFYIGLRFKNIGDAPLSGASITNIRWKSAAGQDMFWTSEKSFNLATLNPQQSTEVWVDRTGTYVHGLCQISLNITPDTSGDIIRTFQMD